MSESQNNFIDVVKGRGILLDKETLDLLKSLNDQKGAVYLLENLERVVGQKIITKKTLFNNKKYLKEIVEKLPGQDKEVVEKTFVKLGISLEIQKEREIVEKPERKESETEDIGYKIFSAETLPDKKLTVKDFVGHFRARYQAIQRILMQRPEVANNLSSIGKLSSDRQSLSIIGIVTEKRITKNKNMIIKFEDLTGEISGIVKQDSELFSVAEELQLDDIVAVKASGNRDLLFIHDIFFPDSFNMEKVKFDEDMSVAFISDIHAGSDRHLKEYFEKFLNWINSGNEDAKKIKYIFFVGDNVDGVGIFPGQEEVLELKTMEEQYNLLESYLRKIPKRITMFMCPGQHDATRVAEPQPVISKKYAPSLYDIENLILVTNPTTVKIQEGEKEFKVLMYHGASIHSFINEIKELREMKAHKCPAKAVRHMLKRRHVAPVHGDVVYIPNAEKDPLVIHEVPDVLCTGEVHRLDIDNYNGTLIITGSCWQAQTDFEEKIGNIPDPGKVPVLNLKTRELKVFDFSEEKDEN